MKAKLLHLLALLISVKVMAYVSYRAAYVLILIFYSLISVTILLLSLLLWLCASQHAMVRLPPSVMAVYCTVTDNSHVCDMNR